MIKANELRIGNWFYWSIISSIGNGFDYIREAKEIGMYNQFKEPVPLTPEILEKCGFKVESVETTYHINFAITTVATTYEIQDGIFRIEQVKNDEDVNVVYNHKCRAKIEYLHQLQNLYYALTGEELTINL